MVDPFVPTDKDLMVADGNSLITQPASLGDASPLGVLAPRDWCRLGEYFSAFGTHLEDDPLDEEIAFFRRVLSNWHTYAVLKRPTRERRLPRPNRPRVKATPSEARGPEGRPVPGRPAPSLCSSSLALSSALSPTPPTPPPTGARRTACVVTAEKNKHFIIST